MSDLSGTVPNWTVAIIAPASVVIGALLALSRKIFCSGKSSQQKDDRMNLLEESIGKTNKDMESLKIDILSYRTKTEKKLDELLENQTTITTNLSSIQGYLEGKFGKENSSIKKKSGIK